MQRYSKKRQAILDCLRSTTSHPSAEWIYEQLRPEYPDLSLATVYRNLGQFKEAGIVRSMGVVDGHEHFDGNVSPHSHVICSSCGEIIDIFDLQVSKEVIASAEKETGYCITDAALQFSGQCKSCQTIKTN